MSESSTAGLFSDDELLALLLDDTVSPPSIVAEMEEAGATPHPVSALESTRSILRGFDPERAAAVLSLPAALRALVLQAAVRSSRVEWLSAVAECRDKSVAKEAKRALHMLRTRGVRVEPAHAPAAAEPATPPASAEELAVLMSEVDSGGGRVVLFAEVARGGIGLAQLVLSDTHGVVAAELVELSRKEYRLFIERVTSTEVMVGEIPRPYARALVAQALDRNALSRTSVPPSFNDVAFLIGPRVGALPSPGRGLPRPPEEDALRSRGAAILELKEFRTWRPPDEVWEECQQRAKTITDSALYIDESQRAAALRDLVGKAAEAFWTREQRDRYAARLFDMAWLMSRQASPQETPLVLATAWALDGGLPIESIPFAFRLFARMLRSGGDPALERMPKKESVSPGGIILPP